MKGIFGAIGEATGKIASKVGFKVKKVTPELLIVGGIGCIVGGTIIACHNKDKVSQIADECEKSVNEHKQIIEEHKDDAALVAAEKKEIAKIKLHKAKDLAVSFGPAGSLIIAGTCMVFKADRIFRSNEKNLLAAINAFDLMGRKYRENVRKDENGEEKDARYLAGTTPVDSDGDDDEPDDNCFVQSEFDRMKRHGYNSPLVYEFSKFTSPIFNTASAMRSEKYGDLTQDIINLSKLKELEETICMWRRYKGHAFLNQALEYIQIDPEPEGQVLGWFDPNRPIEIKRFLTRSVFDPNEPAIRLEFNCDPGEIVSKI